MPTLPTVAPNELIESAAWNAIVNELNSNVVKKDTGATQIMTAFIIGPASDPANANALIRKAYVDTRIALQVPRAGGVVMTGSLEAPRFQVSDRYDAGGNPVGATGARMTAEGQIFGSYQATPTGPSIYLRRAGTSLIAGAHWIRFVTNTDTIAGSISVATASTTAYNTTSDERLKERVGDLADAAERVRLLAARAFRGRWLADEGDGDVWDLLNAHDIAEVAPYAVTGDRGAVAGPPPLVESDDGEMVPDPTAPVEGSIVPQQVNFPALVPLLVAALGEALERIATLEEVIG